VVAGSPEVASHATAIPEPPALPPQPVVAANLSGLSGLSGLQESAAPPQRSLDSRADALDSKVPARGDSERSASTPPAVTPASSETSSAVQPAAVVTPPSLSLPPLGQIESPPALIGGTLPPPPAPVPAPPPATPAPATADPAAIRAAEIAAIETALSRYRQAYSALDVVAVSEIWPAVDNTALARAFNQLQSQSVEFSLCEIDMQGRDARAACDGQTSFVPTVGSRRAQVQRRHWRFALTRHDGGWIIDTVDTRAR
jgi:hypothetical protein